MGQYLIETWKYNFLAEECESMVKLKNVGPYHFEWWIYQLPSECEHVRTPICVVCGIFSTTPPKLLGKNVNVDFEL